MGTVDGTALRAVQQPLKDTYRQDPQQALITLRADGELGAEAVSCSVATGRALTEAGLHPRARFPQGTSNRRLAVGAVRRSILILPHEKDQQLAWPTYH